MLPSNLAFIIKNITISGGLGDRNLASVQYLMRAPVDQFAGTPQIMTLTNTKAFLCNRGVSVDSFLLTL